MATNLGISSRWLTRWATLGAVFALWQFVAGYWLPIGKPELSTLLPPPSAIGVAIAGNVPTLWVDLVQTFVKGALSGYVIGCAAAFGVAVLIDRSPFLQRGLLPVGNFVAALPIVGIAPIYSWPRPTREWHARAA